MKITRNLGMLLLGIWLVGNGLHAFVTINFLNLSLILALLAIVAGILILLER